MLGALKLAVSRRVDARLAQVRRHRVLGELYEAFDGTVLDYARDHGPMYAGALAFYAILSVIPLIVLTAAATGYALHHFGDRGVESASAIHELVGQLRKVVPYIDQSFEGDLLRITENRGRLGLAGFVALLASASQVFRAFEFSCARTFARLTHKDPETGDAAPRSYFASKLWFSVLMTALVLVILVLRLFVGIVAHLATQLPEPVALALRSPLGEGVVSLLVTGAVVAIGFAVLLQVASHQRIAWRFTLLGGLVFFFLFRSAHALYDVYLARFTNMGRLYGPFATIMIVVLWIYFSSTLLIFCGHVVKALQRRVTHGPRWPRGRSMVLQPELPLEPLPHRAPGPPPTP